MKNLEIFVFAVLLASCAHQNTTRSYYLFSESRPGRCDSGECKKLDQFEAQGYRLARNGETTWLGFVDSFYSLRDKLFPGVAETQEVREYRLHQRVLAEKLDRKQLTETEWSYLLEKQLGELRVRLQSSQANEQRVPICTTNKVGETFQTTCY